MNTRCLRLLPCLALLLLPVGAAWSDAPPASVPPHPLSLAEALAAMPDASVADGSVVLTVGPGQVTPVPAPADAPLPDMAVVQTPQTLADRYARTLQVFSHVVALAPPTMTVLNMDPALVSLPLGHLAVHNPIPFLLGTLTAAQLQKMAATGLRFADLSSDQQALLWAALPSPFQIVPKSLKKPRFSGTPSESAAEEARVYTLNTQIISNESLLSSLRLYGFSTPQFTFNTPNSSLSEGYTWGELSTTGADKLVDRSSQKTASALQILLRTELPNVPKDGNLTWRRQALSKTVSLQGDQTVGKLTARLAKVTGLELYADPHYAALPLMMRGDLRTPQPARDVMHALALCVCGTWRQVGPAYVLTDDLQGLGTRQQMLQETTQIWSNRLSDAGTVVNSHLSDLDWVQTLHFAPGDIGALTAAQVEAVHRESGTNSGHLLWGELPAPLQAALRAHLTQHFEGSGEGSSLMAGYEATAKGIARSLRPDTKVQVVLDIRLGVSLPETGVMTLGETYTIETAPLSPPASAAAPAPPQVNSIVLDKPLRGVLCAPRTVEEARAVVALLPKMGLNTLFLDVFTNGRTYFANHILPPVSADASGVLAAALAAAKPQHIAVYAVIDLLCWRKDGASLHPLPWPSGYSEDSTITGEAPDRSVQRQIKTPMLRAEFEQDDEMSRKGNEGWASPLDPRTARCLPALVLELAGTKGLAGLVFQDTAPPGYLDLDFEMDEEGISLGYLLENRLAYLRTYQCDPVDLTTSSSLQISTASGTAPVSLDISVPGFGDTNSKNWTTVRGTADKQLLAVCYAAARSAAPLLPLLMRERQRGAAFDPWTDPKKLNQLASLDVMSHPSQSITLASIISFPYGPHERADFNSFTFQVQNYGMLGNDGKRAGGEVFDLVTGSAPEHLVDTLEKLDVLLKKP